MKLSRATAHESLPSSHRQSLLQFLCGVGLLALLLAFAACDLTAATTSPATATAAGDLDVKVLINDSPENGTVYANMAITLNGNLVTQFSHGETATCNGVALQGSLLGFQGRVPTQPNGGAYVFTYTQSQMSTKVSVEARRGKLLTPLANAVLSRLKNLVMTYEPAKDMTTVNGYASMSSSSGPDGPSQSNSGLYTLNASALSSLTAGSGWIGLHWTSSGNGTVSGPAFHSLATSYDSYADAQVTWT
jgi:hypothetical protein